MKYLLPCIFSLIIFTSKAQNLKPTNINDFVIECMKYNGEIPHKQMGLWLPYNFWQIIGEQMKLSPDAVRDIVNKMKGYMMFAVVDYTISGTQYTFKSEDEIRKSIKLYDSSKNIYLPINTENISPDATRMLSYFQPTLAKLLGQFGEGMHVFLFEAKQIDGKPAIDITKVYHFSLSWEQANLKWTLPFASILPPKYCPVDNEQMKGNWYYCPFHGAKLDK
jgi:hypothetical protein